MDNQGALNQLKNKLIKKNEIAVDETIEIVESIIFENDQFYFKESNTIKKEMSKLEKDMTQLRSEKTILKGENKKLNLLNINLTQGIKSAAEELKNSKEELQECLIKLSDFEKVINDKIDENESLKAKNELALLKIETQRNDIIEFYKESNHFSHKIKSSKSFAEIGDIAMPTNRNFSIPSFTNLTNLSEAGRSVQAYGNNLVNLETVTEESSNSHQQ